MGESRQCAQGHSYSPATFRDRGAECTRCGHKMGEAACGHGRYGCTTAKCWYGDPSVFGLDSGMATYTIEITPTSGTMYEAISAPPVREHRRTRDFMAALSPWSGPFPDPEHPRPARPIGTMTLDLSDGRGIMVELDEAAPRTRTVVRYELYKIEVVLERWTVDGDELGRATIMVSDA